MRKVASRRGARIAFAAAVAAVLVGFGAGPADAATQHAGPGSSTHGWNRSAAGAVNGWELSIASGGVNGWSAPVNGWSTAVNGWDLAVNGWGTAVNGWDLAVNGWGTAVNGWDTSTADAVNGWTTSVNASAVNGW